MRVLALLFFATLICGQDAPPVSTKATVYFYRERDQYKAAKIPVFMDEQQVAGLVNGRFFSAQIDAGRHVFRSKTKLDALVLVLQPGNEYFLRAEVVQASMWKNAQRITQIGNDQGPSVILRLKPEDPKHIVASLR